MAGNPVVGQVASGLAGAGFNKIAIAGILGNAYGESSWNPGSVGSGGGGLWGFTAPPISLGDLQNFASSHGKPWQDAGVQTQFLLQHITPGLKAALNAAHSPAEAATLFMSQWERPGIPRLDVRISGANQAFSMLNGKSFNLPSASPSPSGSTTTTTGGGVDTQGAIIQALLSNDTSSRPTNGGKFLSDLMGNLDTMRTPVTTTSTPLGNTGVSPHMQTTPNGAGDVNPLLHWNLGRTDMGVDASAPLGTPILAPNTMQLVHVYPNWYHNQPYALFQYKAGPNAGKYLYVAEGIGGLPAVGSIVQRGQPLAHYADASNGIEIGWGTSGWQTQAQAQGNTGDASHNNAPAGISFRQYLHSFGV